MDYYDTTEEQVTSSAAYLGVSRYTAHALLERGHSVEKIQAMTPSERFEEFCSWHGLIGWAGTLEETLRECRSIPAIADQSPQGGD
jgi:hypothetical protein